MSIELKVKSKALAEESRVIKSTERSILNKIKKRESRQLKAENFRNQYITINNHRRYDVRNEARRTFLARAYLKGYSYSAIEGSFNDRDTADRYNLNYWADSIASMVQKYGPWEKRRETNAETIKEWYNT